MYGKLFARIFESSLMEEPVNVRYTFMALIPLCDPKGYVIGTDVAISRRLNIPLQEFQECILRLMQPDPNSNSKKHEGRRVIRSDIERGYFVVNYPDYRDIKSPEERREYMREYMRKYRSQYDVNNPDSCNSVDNKDLGEPVNTVNNGKPKLAKLGEADADAEADAEAEEKKRGAASTKTRTPRSLVFDERHLKFAAAMWKRVSVIFPLAKEPVMESWANDLRMLEQLDKRDLVDAWQLFVLANNDHFWQLHIDRPIKLRKQYARLDTELRTISDKKAPPPKSNNLPDLTPRKETTNAGT